MISARQIIIGFGVVVVLSTTTYSDANMKSNATDRERAQTRKTPVLTTSIPTPTPRAKSTLSATSALTGMSMSWSVVTGGGIAGGQSTQYGLSGAAGQSVIGRGYDSQYGVGIGFYPGVETCNCDNVADMNGDNLYDSIDLNILIGALFFNGENPKDPQCPNQRSDLNCDSSSDSLDLNLMINFLFFNGPAPCNACTGQPV